MSKIIQKFRHKNLCFCNKCKIVIQITEKDLVFEILDENNYSKLIFLKKCPKCGKKVYIKEEDYYPLPDETLVDLSKKCRAGDTGAAISVIKFLSEKKKLDKYNRWYIIKDNTGASKRKNKILYFYEIDQEFFTAVYCEEFEKARGWKTENEAQEFFDKWKDVGIGLIGKVALISNHDS
jgi:hypothetical protein